MSTIVNPLEQFHWTPQPAAEALIKKIVDQVIAASPAGARLRDRMRDEAGVRFIDCIDRVWVPKDELSSEQLRGAGFVITIENGASYVHPGGIFPAVVLHTNTIAIVDLKVESVADFAAANGGLIKITHSPGDRMRLGVLDDRIGVVERHGFRRHDGDPSSKPSDELVRAALRHSEAFRLRRRDFDTDEEGFEFANQIIDSSISSIGVDWTCDLFFAAEREFWQRRNRAAQFQKSRQDRLGLGWANHDHHTYRSSRKHFARLIATFEKLGFVCRERFYPGADAGWGAQVLEQPNAGVIIFADVDISPDELFNDFAHETLPERDHLGTVGLWCALHGEAFLQAGMHHLECQFDFDSLKRQMEEMGIRVMKPFTDFPYLRQAFTEGERWPVVEKRLAAVLASKQITPEQAVQIRAQGAIGSHLENLERNEGFKGFNQKGVSEIIAKTDPRRHLST